MNKKAAAFISTFGCRHTKQTHCNMKSINVVFYSKQTLHNYILCIQSSFQCNAALNMYNVNKTGFKILFGFMNFSLTA